MWSEGLEKRLGVERADAVWARSEVWAGSTQEEGDNWRVQLGEGSDGDLWEAVDLLLERMQGKVEVNWIRGHADKTTTRRMMSKHQRGNVRADANCTAVKRGVRSRVRLPLPRRKSWRLCYDGVEMVGILRKELRDRMKTERLMRYFKETRGWGEEADRWLGEGVLAGWRMTSKAMHQRIAAVRMMFSMWLTEDVQVNRATKLTEAEKGVLSKCALCGQCAAGRRNEHLLFKCTDARVVEVRKEVEAAVERKVSRLVKPGPVKESIMVPWRLDSEGRPPDIGVVVEVEAAIGTVLGAATPAEGYRRLVSKQEAGSLIAGGSRLGTTGVHHQVHQPEEVADEGWEKQSSWKGSRRKRVLLEQDDDEEELEAAPSEAEEAEEGPVVPTSGEQDAKMCYEKRQMVWKGMSGSCWTDLVQQWGVRKVEALQLQKSIAAVMREVGPKLGDLHWREATGMGQKSRVLPAEAAGMLEAARHAKRLRDPGWRGDRGQGRWPVQRLLEWAVKELTLSRRGVEMELGGLEDWLEREQMERKMGDSLLKWLGHDKPPSVRVSHKVWRKQLVDRTRQLKLGADRARQQSDMWLSGLKYGLFPQKVSRDFRVFPLGFHWKFNPAHFCHPFLRKKTQKKFSKSEN